MSASTGWPAPSPSSTSTPWSCWPPLIAVGTAYGGLRIFLARQGGMRLALSAVAFGVRGLGHALHGHVRHAFPAGAGSCRHDGGLVASPQVLALVVALLCFVIAAGFLLFLVPEPRRRERRPRQPRMTTDCRCRRPTCRRRRFCVLEPSGAAASQRVAAAPLGGLGQPRAAPVVAAAGRGRRRHAFHRCRRCPQRAGGRALYAGP